ncbi:MAG: glycerol-3-phosphate 1-O-acyltransferase PlsY [Candidatus Nitrotoga sp.]|nr:glycerol-3-phosphate 1-O-acyltransferase PlsY [Candidatus Nitrotoga sp.]MBP0117417.1 glycerol-3-phosphate 1-O-acyltransferase PlsY [Candidatus Nitrotoga sp.]MBP0122848.1 glycerol-3-phosphate 1-O-acyltransferase PlsY [Candidatus Nitrotoga sp.]MBP0125760.1 glycerol-3-phosphate 1-O-acyltransferase PlsY [Candidatus Nitrotoga sp.]
MMSLFFVLCAYLIGSISFALVTSKLFALPDPRTYGSQNPGATNVLRSGNKWAALLTLTGDAAKGWVAVWLAQNLALTGSNPLLIAAVAFAVFIGHLFPIFMHFRGGKGVATVLGILMALNIWLGLAALMTWVLVALISRLSSLAALLAALSAPIYAIGLALPSEYLPMLVGMSLLLIWRHKSNIRNIMAGKEARLMQKIPGQSE